MSDEKIPIVVGVVMDKETIDKIGHFFQCVMMTEGKSMIECNPMYLFASKIVAYAQAGQPIVRFEGKDFEAWRDKDYGQV